MSDRVTEALIQSVVGLLAVAVIAVAWRLEPDRRGFGTHEQLGFRPCSFLSATGRPCFSCGMTTAFSAMAHLRPLRAFEANPLGALLFLGVAILPFHLLHSFMTGKSATRILYGRLRPFLLPGFLAMLGATWLYKLATTP
jgi:hypothetical protein